MICLHLGKDFHEERCQEDFIIISLPQTLMILFHLGKDFHEFTSEDRFPVFFSIWGKISARKDFKKISLNPLK